MNCHQREFLTLSICTCLVKGDLNIQTKSPM